MPDLRFDIETRARGRNVIRRTERDVEGLQQEVDKLDREMRQVTVSSRDLDDALDRVSTRTAGLTALFTEGLDVVGDLATSFVDFIQRSAEFERTVELTARATGRSNREVAAYARTLERFGFDLRNSVDLLTDFEEKLGDARLEASRGTTGEIGEYFKSVGVEISEADLTLERFIEKLRGLERTQRAHVADTFFGGPEGVRLVEALLDPTFGDELAISLDLGLSDEAREAVVQASKDFVLAAQIMNSQVGELALIWGFLRDELGLDPAEYLRRQQEERERVQAELDKYPTGREALERIGVGRGAGRDPYAPYEYDRPGVSFGSQFDRRLDERRLRNNERLLARERPGTRDYARIAARIQELEARIALIDAEQQAAAIAGATPRFDTSPQGLMREAGERPIEPIEPTAGTTTAGGAPPAIDLDHFAQSIESGIRAFAFPFRLTGPEFEPPEVDNPELATARNFFRRGRFGSIRDRFEPELVGPVEDLDEERLQREATQIIAQDSLYQLEEIRYALYEYLPEIVHSGVDVASNVLNVVGQGATLTSIAGLLGASVGLLDDILGATEGPPTLTEDDRERSRFNASYSYFGARPRSDLLERGGEDEVETPAIELPQLDPTLDSIRELLRLIDPSLVEDFDALQTLATETWAKIKDETDSAAEATAAFDQWTKDVYFPTLNDLQERAPKVWETTTDKSMLTDQQIQAINTFLAPGGTFHTTLDDFEADFTTALQNIINKGGEEEEQLNAINILLGTTIGGVGGSAGVLEAALTTAFQNALRDAKAFVTGVEDENEGMPAAKKAADTVVESAYNIGLAFQLAAGEANNLTTAINNIPKDITITTHNITREQVIREYTGGDPGFNLPDSHPDRRPPVNPFADDPFNRGGQQPFNPSYAQVGYDGIVSRPTAFIAGEAGAERVTVEPLGGNGAGQPVVINNTFEVRALDGSSVVDVLSSPQAQRAIGEAVRDGTSRGLAIVNDRGTFRGNV